MKKTLKRNLITVACLACACMAGIGGMAIKAQAETLTVTDNFYMSDGAAIRIKGGKTPSGIRWEVNVTEGYYNQITENGEKEVTFGTLVDDTAIVSMEANATEVNIPCTATPNFVDGIWSYYASITYDKLAETLAGEGYNYSEQQIAQTLALVYEETLYARGYAVVDGEYIYAETADVARSIKGIAMNCLIEENTTGNDDVTADNKADFVAYAGGEYTVIKNDGATKNAYNVTTATGKVTTQNDLKAGTYSVYVGAKQFDDVTLAADGKATATIAGLGAKACVTGEVNNVRFVGQEGEVYQVPFVSATHVIGTKDELIAFWDSYLATPSETVGWYAVLTADIDLENIMIFHPNYYIGKTVSGAGFWQGHFNGLGHVVSNCKLNGLGGLFGAVAQSAVIENVAFVGVKQTDNWYVLCNGGAYGVATVRNVYIQGETTTGNAIVVRLNTRLSNVIVNMTNSGSGNTVVLGEGTYEPTNTYMIGDFSKGDYNNKFTLPIYESVEAWATENLSNVTAENGWDMEIWSYNDFGISFGDKIVAKYAVETEPMVYGAAYTYANNAYTKQDTFTVDVSSLIGEATQYTVLLDGEEVETNGVLTLNVADYTVNSEHEVLVAANGKVYSQPFTLATHVIGTKDELIAFWDSYIVTRSETVGWYAVLTDNIDLEGATITHYNYYRGTNTSGAGFWQGHFNGLGHVVSNCTLDEFGGFFGAVADGAVIENVAFVGVKQTKGWYVLCNGGANGVATVRNVYLQVETMTGEAVIVRLNVKLENVIVNATNSGSGNAVVLGEGTNAPANTYIIGDFNRGDYNNTFTLPVYESVGAWATENLSNITAENGWNTDVWSVKDGSLYFGSALVG